MLTKHKRHWRYYGGHGVYVAGPGCGYYKARWYDTGSYHWKRKYYICRGWY